MLTKEVRKGNRCPPHTHSPAFTSYTLTFSHLHIGSPSPTSTQAHLSSFSSCLSWPLSLTCMVPGGLCLLVSCGVCS